MEWISKRPDAPGWYWMRHIKGGYDTRIIRVKYYHDVLEFADTSGCNPMPIEDIEINEWEFYGPLEIPK